LGAGIKTFVPPPEPPGSVREAIDIDDPKGPVTLRYALSLALMRSPALEGTAWDIRVGEAKKLQEGLYQNPTVGMAIGGVNSSAFFPQLEYTSGISQTFELGKHEKKSRVAALEKDLAGWDYETRRLDVLTGTVKFFVEVLEAQEQMALYDELVRTSEQILDLATEKDRTKRDMAGAVKPADNNGSKDRPEIIKAEIHVYNARVQREQAQAKLEAARRRLAATWGQTPPTFEKAEGVLSEVSPVPPFQDLSEMIYQNPDVARWNKEVEQRRAALELEKAKRIPDVTLSGGVQQFNDGSGTGPFFGASMPLPIFDRNQGNILGARYKLEKVGAESRDAALKALTSLSNAYLALASSYTEAKGLKTEVVPAYERFFNACYQLLLKEKSGVSDVVDTHQALFEARAKYNEVLAAYHKSKADVERLIGQSLEKVN
jgi:cobalt-zinc-cadmium efflux system outer membrane protein